MSSDKNQMMLISKQALEQMKVRPKSGSYQRSSHPYRRHSQNRCSAGREKIPQDVNHNLFKQNWVP